MSTLDELFGRAILPLADEVDPAKGAALVGYDDGTVKAALDLLNARLTNAAINKSIVCTSVGQTVYVIPGGYPVGFIDVTALGVDLDVAAGDYAATDGATVVVSSEIAAHIPVGGRLVVKSITSFAVANAVELSTLSAAGGSALIGYGSQTVKQALDSVTSMVPLGDYAAVSAYTGRAQYIQVTGLLVSTTPMGIAGLFAYDAADTTTLPDGATVLVDPLNRRWKRQFTGPANVDWFSPLVTGTGATEDWTAAIQQVLTSYTAVHFPYRALGYRVTNPVNLQSGQRVSGSGRVRVFRDDQTNHIFKLVSVTDVIVEGLTFSHSYDMQGDRGQFSAVYALQSSQVKVTNCEFHDIGLFAVSTDVSGDGWTITENRFFNIAGTAYDARGGKGHIVTNNYILNTGDDAIDVANTPGAGSKRTVIANNVIINPGQIKIGGGAIRVNSAGASITTNQIENANMFFVCVAALSTDGTIKPTRVIISNNVGYGIKPTNNNTTGCVMVKNAGAVKIHDNDFDPIGDALLTVTNVVNNGLNQCRFTVANHGYTTANIVRVAGVVGVPSANGSAAVTVIDANTFDVATFSFTGAYTSGGQVWNAVVGIRAYSGDNTPSQNVLVDAHNNRFTRVDAPYRIMLLGLDKLYFNDNIVDTYYSPAQMFDTSLTSKLQLNRNKWLNCAGTAGIFDGNGTGLVSITDLEMNDNELTLASGNVNTNVLPFNFNLATVNRAEARRNRLNGMGGRSAPTNVQQFNLGNNVAQFIFDGDFSGTRYNQGNGTIPQGAVTSAPISHGCVLIDGQAQQPKTLELQVNVSLGSTTPVFVQVEQEFSTTFTVMTNVAAPAGGVAFSWRLSAVVQRYVNGALAA